MQFDSTLARLAEETLSVSQAVDLLNTIIKPLRVTIRGEITSVTPRGHVYFNLSDPQAKATLNCIVWQSTLRRLSVDLKPGEEIQVTGQFNVYAPMGKLSLIVDRATPVGEGALKKAFEKLKQELEAQGYFDPAHKHPLPPYPKKIALLTSNHGDAIKDFQTHLAPAGITLHHYDVRVEGVQAIDTIVSALQQINRNPQGAELIVITRGGGSLESLQAFNSLEVAEAIYASKLPVVSAVGHENDITIADLVADVRASTPTDAGKIVGRHWELAQRQLAQFRQALLHHGNQVISSRRQFLDHTLEQLVATTAQKIATLKTQLSSYRQQLPSMLDHQLDTFYQQLSWYSQQLPRPLHHQLQLQRSQLRSFSQIPTTLQHQLALLKHQLRATTTLLNQADPHHKLQQGYTITRNDNGQIVKSIADTNPDTTLITQLADGQLASTITKISKETS